MCHYFNYFRNFNLSKKNKSQKSEINTPLNDDADQILPVDPSNQKKDNQNNDNEVPKSKR